MRHFQQHGSQRAPSIAANQVLGGHASSVQPIEQLQPTLLQLERRQEQQNRMLNCQFRAPGCENKVGSFHVVNITRNKEML